LGFALTLFAQELYTQPYDTINWFRQRNNVAQVDIWAPHTRTLEALMGVLAGYEMLGPVAALREAGIRRAYEMVVMEDENTGYQGIGPVNKMLNYLVRWDVEGPDSDVMRQHREKLKDFMWMGPEGMRMTGTNGSQLWGECLRPSPPALPCSSFSARTDTSFIAQALVDSGLVDDAENKAACARVLHWLDECQIRENPRHHKAAYRFATKGAWPFSTKEQGYTVSDCTAEGMKAVIMLQKDAG
jgi:lanosterol synthase